MASVNIYDTPPTGPIQTPAIVYRPDNPWIERRQSFRSWLENYVAVCVVQAASGGDGVAQLYEMALGVLQAVEADPAGRWEFRSVGGIVETEQAGVSYLACAVRLSYRAEY